MVGDLGLTLSMFTRSRLFHGEVFMPSAIVLFSTAYVSLSGKSGFQANANSPMSVEK